MAPSPEITHISWGVIRISPSTTSDDPALDNPTSGKDFKLFPGGSRLWDWSETGTRHSPGIQIADVEELIEAGAEQVVLSRGMHEKLLVQEETVAWLEKAGVKVHVHETTVAVEVYNKLVADGVLVGGCFHSTC